MGYSIYGEILERGHCEVHPNIAEEYPCYVCTSQEEERQALEALEYERERVESEQYHEYCMEQLWDAWMDVMKHGHLQQGLMP